MTRWLTLGLVLLFLLLQYRLWFAQGSLAELSRLQEELQKQQALNVTLRERNRVLEMEVLELQRGTAALEERAREKLGMIREDEIFYSVPEKREDRRGE